jgi:hypothetical protein
VIAISEYEGKIAVMLGNPVIIDAYQGGIADRPGSSLRALTLCPIVSVERAAHPSPRAMSAVARMRRASASGETKGAARCVQIC